MNVTISGIIGSRISPYSYSFYYLAIDLPMFLVFLLLGDALRQRLKLKHVDTKFKTVNNGRVFMYTVGDFRGKW